MIRPRALKFGDTIGIIGPASPTRREKVQKSYDKIIELGFKAKVGRSCYGKYGYLSGKDNLRADDINEMFKDEKIDGIICLRGGYGTPRILDLVDYEIIRKNPKVFVGYSDITGLHIAFNQIARLVTYHGPMLASDMIEEFDDFSRDNLLDIIMEKSPSYEIENPVGEDLITINPGIAEGPIVGGNLSLIVTTIGTAYEIDTRDKILFIEEVGEEPYKIDRMFNQLRLSGKLGEASGIILGDFNNCQPKNPKDSLRLEEVINEQIKPAGKPSIYNLQSGHCKPMITLPLGVRARLDGDKKELVLKEGCIK